MLQPIVIAKVGVYRLFVGRMTYFPLCHVCLRDNIMCTGTTKGLLGQLGFRRGKNEGGLMASNDVNTVVLAMGRLGGAVSHLSTMVDQLWKAGVQGLLS